MPKKYQTPLLDELEKGPFPSFVTEIKKAAAKNDMAADELGQLEKSYRDRAAVIGSTAVFVGVRGIRRRRYRQILITS